jgi:hypothetical protein
VNARPKALPIKAAIATLRKELEGQAASLLLQRLEDHPGTERTMRKILKQMEKHRALPRDGLLNETIAVFRYIVKVKIAADTFNKGMVLAVAQMREVNREAKLAFEARQKSIARNVLRMSSNEMLMLYLEQEGAELRQEKNESRYFSLDLPRFFGMTTQSDWGSCARTRFSRGLSNWVWQLTRKWLDAEVATLTEILFDETVTAEAARAARKLKPGQRPFWRVRGRGGTP